MGPTSLVRVGLAVLALAGVLAAVAGLLTPSGAAWPRADVLGGLGLALVASVAWWWTARGAGPADGTLSRSGWWPARRRIVADTVLILGGICIVALPAAVKSTYPDLVALRDSHPVIRQVGITSVENVSKSGRRSTTYHADVTVEVPFPVGPPVEVTRRVHSGDNPRHWKAIYALYSPSQPEAGLILGEERDWLDGLLDTRTPTWLVVELLLGLAVIAVRGVGAGPPGGWRAQARLRRALRCGAPAIVLDGRLEPSAVAAASTLLAEFHGADASGTIHFDPTFDLQRMKDDFSGRVTLSWLPGTRPGRWRRLHAAILVADNGRYAPVGIRSLPPVHATRQAPVPDRLVGPFPGAGGANRGLLVLATVLAVGVLCSGVLVPAYNAATSGAGLDNDAVSGLGFLLACQFCLLVMPLVAIAYYRAATPAARPPESRSHRSDTTAGGGRPTG